MNKIRRKKRTRISFVRHCRSLHFHIIPYFIGNWLFTSLFMSSRMAYSCTARWLSRS